MGLAEKAFGLVSRASLKWIQQDDPVLLPSDRAVTRSPVTENMGVRPLSEDLILIGRTDKIRPLASFSDRQKSTRCRLLRLNVICWNRQDDGREKPYEL